VTVIYAEVLEWLQYVIPTKPDSQNLYRVIINSCKCFVLRTGKKTETLALQQREQSDQKQQHVVIITCDNLSRMTLRSHHTFKRIVVKNI
jgi:hypothetical protein